MATISDRPSTATLAALAVPGAFPDVDPDTPQNLSETVYARRAEYTEPRKIRIKVGTWNVAALEGPEKDIRAWLVDGQGITQALNNLHISPTDSIDHRISMTEKESGEDEGASPKLLKKPIEGRASSENANEHDISLYAIGLQEIVDVSSATEFMKPYGNASAVNKFKTAMGEALPAGYELVAEQQLIGLLLLIYVSPDMKSEVHSVSSTHVGTGFGGYLGNKGATATRLVLGETTKLVFINCHLAAGADASSLQRRNWDASQVLSRTKFDPIPVPVNVAEDRGETIGTEDFAFWFGDLNYRLEGMPADDIRRLLMIHTQDESKFSHRHSYESLDGDTLSNELMSPNSEHGSEFSTASSSDMLSGSATASPLSVRSVNTFREEEYLDLDPASIQATIESLMPHDELRLQQRTRKVFHDGWKEGKVTFLPTYKYDVGSIGIYDSSSKRRCPSWCDRIIYRARKDKLEYERKAKDHEESKKKDNEMQARGLDKANDDEDVLFDYNPEADGEDYDETETADHESTKAEESEEDLHLKHYTSHQYVTSSDHKPLSAIFELSYDAIVTELKVKVHDEVARQFDRAENESRPTVTLIVDQQISSDHEEDEAEGTSLVHFGSIRFAKLEQRNITVANTGRVHADISFIGDALFQQSSQDYNSTWITIRTDTDPDENASTDDGRPVYKLEPGDTCHFELTAKIDKIKQTSSLNTGQTKLDDILILHVKDGRDHFIPVRANWLASAFGQSMTDLVKAPEGGIRKLQQLTAESKGTNSTESTTMKWSAPRELFRLIACIEDLVERTLAEWDMVSAEDETPPWQRYAAWPFAEDSWTLVNEFEREERRLPVYEALDCDQPFDSTFPPETSALHRLEIMAETLLLFLEGLRDGVITEQVWERLHTGIVTREKTRQTLPLEDERTWILENLSTDPAHNVSFVLVTSMLSRLSQDIAASVKMPPSKSAAATSAITSSSLSSKGPELPTSPISVQRKTLSQIPEVARQQIVDRSFAAIFADKIIRVSDAARGKENKERRAREERMRRVIEVFLKEEGT